MESVSRFLKAPEQSFFLFGPRGTGKSTWARAQFKGALRIDLLEPDQFRAYSARPERVRELLESQALPGWVIIDEVQKVPALLSVVHALIEEKRGWRFVMTGSSARKLKRAGVDLLAGRALMKTLHPFMAAELEKGFKLEEALKSGLLPLVLNAEHPDDILKAYAALYLKEEVQMEGLVRNVGNFSRFLEAISFSHGSVLNISNVARDCEVQRKVVEGYVEILEDLLLSFRIPAFSKRAKRAIVTHPKFYYFDAGVFRSLRPQGPLDRPQETDGQCLEGLLAQHLRAWAAYRGDKSKLFFWRTHSGSEVDFVVYGEDGFWAIEVKNTGKVKDEDLKPLRVFLEEYPEARAIFLYRGKERLKRNGILCMPCEDFLRDLHPGKTISA